MLGASFLLGGLRHHVQDYNRANARLQVGMLFLSTFALLVPSSISEMQSASVTESLSLSLALLLMLTYCLGLVFSLRTHRDLFGSGAHDDVDEAHLPVSIAVILLAVTTLFVALVSEIFVESVEEAAQNLGMTPAFVGFVVVALVGGAAEMVSAFAGARKDRLDLSVSIALGSATQIALFVAPVLVLLSYAIGPTPMTLEFWPGAIIMMFIATMAAGLVTNGGKSAWFVGVLMIDVFLVFALTLYTLPPAVR
jgi:Ca2+:H+ antiporter